MRDTATPTGYILYNGCPVGVRVSASGNLVAAGSAGDGMSMFARAGQYWPKLYPNEHDAWLAQRAIEDRCNHDWRWLSHEEKMCRKCGCLELVPDF